MVENLAAPVHSGTMGPLVLSPRGPIMPRPLPVPIREAISRRRRQVQSASEIAASLGVPVSTVYRLLQRFRREGWDGIRPGYRSPAAESVPPDVAQAPLALRREHPTRGAAMIRVHL